MNVTQHHAVRPLCDAGVCKVKCGWVRGLDDVDECDEEIKLSDDEGVQSGTRPVTKMLDPKLPSLEEVLAHQLNHIPYRNGSPHSVKGRGKEMNHKQRNPDEQNGISEYHLDYCFPGDEWHRLTILVAIERHTKMKRRW